MLKNIWKKTKQLLKLIFYPIYSISAWKKTFGYVYEPKSIDIIWRKILTTGFITVPMESIYAKIWTEKGLKIKPIEKTPHYKWIKDIIKDENDLSSQALYHNYIKTFFPRENTEAQLTKIKQMVLLFKNQKNFNIKDGIVTHPPILKDDSKFCVVICDGVHRTAIAKVLNQKSLKCRVIKEKIKYKDYI